jgi:dTDP-4-dehydrorhamnose 3,5-epimerase
MLKVTPTRLPDVLIVEPHVFRDERGLFLESWNQLRFDEALGTAIRFVQDNQSRSTRGVLRGLHYQRTQPQGKLVRAVTGRVFDVAVDLRRSSPWLGQWVGVELSADNQRQLWVPAGFAHGFLVLSEQADVVYKVTHHHDPADDRALAWNDAKVGIDWPIGELGKQPTLSARDRAAPTWDATELID